MKKTVLVLALVMICAISSFCQQKAPTPTPSYGTFAFTDEVRLAGSADRIYDALTGDVTGWWDHSFSKKPYRMYIEPKPGGGFYEIFSPDGDGVLHATVTYAQRGSMLRFAGPLGLAGKALDMVTTFTFTAAGQDSTVLTLSVHAAGEMDAGLEKMVRGVWHHFLVDRFKPYVESPRPENTSK